MASTTIESAVVRPRGERRIYVGGAIAALLVIFAGFAPTYYLKAAFGTPELSALKHVHGVVMSAWFTLFLVQAALVASGNTATHRKVGIAGIDIAVLVLIVGMRLGIESARDGISP